MFMLMGSLALVSYGYMTDGVIVRTIHLARKAGNTKRHVVVLEDLHWKDPATISSQIQSLLSAMPADRQSILLIESLSPEHIHMQTNLQHHAQQLCQAILSAPVEKTDTNHALKKQMEHNCRQNLVIDNFNALAHNQFLQRAASQLSCEIPVVHIDETRTLFEDWLTIGSILRTFSIYREIPIISSKIDPSMSVEAFINLLRSNFNTLLLRCRQLQIVIKNAATATMLEHYHATITSQINNLNEILASLSPPSQRATDVLYQEMQTPPRQPLTSLLQFYATLEEHPTAFNAHQMSVEVNLLHALLVNQKHVSLAIVAAGMQHTTMLRTWLADEGFSVDYDSYITLPSHCIDINMHNVHSYAQKEHDGTFTFEDIIPCRDEHFYPVFGTAQE